MNVVEEMDKLYNIYGVRGILIRDAVFTLNKERINTICNELIKRRIKLSWRCETRIDCLDLPLINLMKKAGCIGINIGIESGSKEVLAFLGSRPKNLDSLDELAKECNKIGIDLFLFFIIGLPKERKESVIKTVSWIRKLSIPYAQFTIATPYPGTNLEDWAIKNNYILNKDENKITGYECLMRNEKMGPKTIVSLYKYANITAPLSTRNIIKRIRSRGILQISKEAIKIFLSTYYFFITKFTKESR